MEHVSFPHTFEAALDLFSLIHLNIFMNALHPSTYVPMAGVADYEQCDANILAPRERMLFCMSRGMALALAAWFTENYSVKWSRRPTPPTRKSSDEPHSSSEGEAQLAAGAQSSGSGESRSNGEHRFPNQRTEHWASLDTFVGQDGTVDFDALWKNWIAYLAASVYGYKVVAEGRGHHGAVGCTAKSLKAQLRASLELVSPTSLELFDTCTAKDSTWRDADETYLRALPDWLDWLMGETSEFQVRRRDLDSHSSRDYAGRLVSLSLREALG
jgi:hypothetical protein